MDGFHPHDVPEGAEFRGLFYIGSDAVSSVSWLADLEARHVKLCSTSAHSASESEIDIVLL